MLELAVKIDRPGFGLDVACRVSEPVTGLFGPSGVGKSTLLSCIAGLTKPDQGRIVCRDRVLFDDQRRINVPAHKRRVGMVFQDTRLLPHYSVRGNLGYGLPPAPRRERQLKLEEIARLLGIADLLDRNVMGLSGGEQHRVALGRALLCSPRLLLLDEPLSGLDWHLRVRALTLLQRVQTTTGIPILLASHDPDDIRFLTDRVLVLRPQGSARRTTVSDGDHDHLPGTQPGRLWTTADRLWLAGQGEAVALSKERSVRRTNLTA